MTGFAEESGYHPESSGEIRGDFPVPIGGRGLREVSAFGVRAVGRGEHRHNSCNELDAHTGDMTA
ncbi:MAG: hypothetical protein KAS29_01890 [Bacteroidales bacterium]|nr:hypothetical protein [Bacteroidales bacterium]